MELIQNLIKLLESQTVLLETYCQRFSDKIPEKELKDTIEGIELTKQIIAETKKDFLEFRLRSEGRLN